MRTIGIDLGVKGEHKAVIVDEQGRFVSPLIKLGTEPAGLARLLEQAQQGNPDGQVQVVMESTGMAWLPVAVYLTRQEVCVYLVNSRQVADLRRYYKRHAKSDRIDARVLAKLPSVDQESLYRLELPGAAGLACQRGCRQLERLLKQATAAKNRLIAMDRFAWPGLQEQVFADPFAPAVLWFRQHYYNPLTVHHTGAEQIRLEWLNSEQDPGDPGDWVVGLVALAEQVLAIYGTEGEYLDYERLQAEAEREQALLAFVEQDHHRLQLHTVRPLYRQLHPSRNLETIPGVGQDGAAVFACFIGRPSRFASLRKHRSWSGMVPNSRQSSNSQAVGLKITQAGPQLIRKFAFMDADTARKRDPQLAAIYYDQMVNKGKHHTQAVCTCATHLLDRVLTVLRQDRPYELRDLEGNPISPPQALEMIAQRYTVPQEVRRRNSRRARKERAEKRAEKKSREGKQRLL